MFDSIILHLSSVYALSFYHLNNFQYLVQYLYSKIQPLHHTLHRLYHYLSSILLITILLNYTQYSLHRIYHLHLALYLIFIYFHITSISPYLYRGFVPCTGDVEPSILVQNGLYLLLSLFISFSTTLGMSLSKTSFRVSPLTAFLSIWRVTIP